MYYTITPEIQQMIEDIQRDSFMALDADLDEVLNRVKEAKQNPNKKERLTPKKEFEIFKETLHILRPEHHYHSSEDYFKLIKTCGISKYDNPTFLERFVNIAPLCHEFYSDGDVSLKKNIIVTSLPFLNMNGICIKQSNDTDIVFLNEGLLSSIPIIYRYLLPICEPELFGKGSHDKNLTKVLDIISSCHFFKSSFNDTRSNADITLPNANESWMFKEVLKQQIESSLQDKNGQSAPKEKKLSSYNKPPSEYPFNNKLAQFLACRGAFVFLLGHEFCHAYNDHCEQKSMDDLDLRDPDFLNYITTNFANELSKFKDVEKDFKNFHVDQPIEEEADANGLLCVLKYCTDNELDDQRTLSVMIGAISVFIIMEINEHLSLIRTMGKNNAKEYLNVSPIVRNMFFGGEHPAPTTRLEMALRQFQKINLVDNSFFEGLEIMSHQLNVLCNSISQHILAMPKSIETYLGSSEMLNNDLSQIFNNHMCLGAQDLSSKHHTKIKNHFSPKLAPIIQLFRK